MSKLGTWDCANRACEQYHATEEHPFTDYGCSPPCSACGRPMRLLHVKRPMPERVKQALRQRAVERRMPA